MLNTSWNTTYKYHARTVPLAECAVYEAPFTHLYVDVRSRVFRHIRIAVPNRSVRDKIDCVFALMRDVKKEEARVYDNALSEIKREVLLTLSDRCTFVFPSPVTCPRKQKSKEQKRILADVKRGELLDAVRCARANPLDVELLMKCHTAFESHLISNADEICLVGSGREADLGVPSYLVPTVEDSFESDRTCARLARNDSSAVLSEDMDCAALFGARIVVKEVYKHFFCYVAFADVLTHFCSSNRKDLVHKCCLMGTDYNFGLKGVGPVKAKKLEAPKAKALFETCMAAQHINVAELYKFFMIPGKLQ